MSRGQEECPPAAAALTDGTFIGERSKVIMKQSVIPKAIPARAGVGLKADHYRTILVSGPDIGFFEVHAENYMGAGGPPHRYLGEIRNRYPMSLHGVGLSIGADRPPDRDHLGRLKHLIQHYQPERLRPAARHQQCACRLDQPAVGPSPLYRRLPAGERARNPSRRSYARGR